MCKYVNDLGSCRLTACARQFTPMIINEAIDFLNKSKWTLAPHALAEAKWNEAVDMAIEALQVDRPTGEWVSNHDGTWNCSKCGLRVLVYAKGNFCPNCGARMRREKSE